mmetsp:Transcript_30901/g.30387  ORF Transcript_30901/g.30387 Transcript_30901/m.30387 type:complete len:161 (+) Transcript_30901:117-599(+)
MCVCADPGYVHKKFDIIPILDIAIKNNIDYENFCFYDMTIKSDDAFHCLYCKNCIERFDHHCPYLNNCLGYKNHKYFLVFLISFCIYLIFSTLTYILLIAIIIKDDFIHPIVGYTLLTYTLLVNLLQCLPLFYQLKEQLQKLRKIEIIEPLEGEDDETKF